MTNCEDSSHPVLVTRDSDIWILTLNNPQRRNAYSATMKQALRSTLDEAMSEDACKAIVITGAGGNFCAGGDVSQMRDREIVEMRQFMESSYDTVRLLASGPKPVVTAIEGLAYGAGVSLSAATDYVVAARDARICVVFMRIGLVPDVGLRWALSRRVGASKAQELIMLANEINGDEAARIGLANQVCEPGQALSEALGMARRLAATPAVAFALNKAAYFEGAHSFSESAFSELAYQPILKLTDDHREAVQAFKEKRSPVFRGQ